MGGESAVRFADTLTQTKPPPSALEPELENVKNFRDLATCSMGALKVVMCGREEEREGEGEGVGWG
jgi:hypothetical protein